jgi:hypothetical protein
VLLYPSTLALEPSDSHIFPSSSGLSIMRVSQKVWNNVGASLVSLACNKNH